MRTLARCAVVAVVAMGTTGCYVDETLGGGGGPSTPPPITVTFADGTEDRGATCSRWTTEATTFHPETTNLSIAGELPEHPGLWWVFTGRIDATYASGAALTFTIVGDVELEIGQATVAFQTGPGAYDAPLEYAEGGTATVQIRRCGCNVAGSATSGR